MLSRTQAEPCRTVKQEQEEISRNHIPRPLFTPLVGMTPEVKFDLRFELSGLNYHDFDIILINVSSDATATSEVEVRDLL